MRVLRNLLICLLICSCRGDAGFGDSQASAEALHNGALSAVMAGRLRDAEALAESAWARGGETMKDRAQFLLGCAAYQRALRAELLTQGPESGLPAYDAAIAAAERARDLWLPMVLRRKPWPEALRNVERATRKMAQMRAERKQQIEKNKNIGQRKSKESSATKANKESASKGKKEPMLATPRRWQHETATNNLTPTELLLRKLAQKDIEKKKLRRAQRRIKRHGLEKHW